MRKNVICIIQARMDSSRLPAKVVAPIEGNPLLYYVIKRVSLSKIEKIVVATTEMPVDSIIGFIAKESRVDCFQGEESDVLARFVQTAKLFNASAVVRITADCPLIDPEVINKIMDIYKEYPESDYIFIEGYPRGLGDVEFISNSALEKCLRETDKDQTYYREHVMTYITENPDKFNIRIEKFPIKEHKDYRLCVDELDDLKVVREVYKHFLPRLNFNSDDIIGFLEENPDIAKMNRHIKQKTG